MPGVRILTIGGDQLTGKSTLAKDLAARLRAPHVSAGSFFRAVARERGLNVAELSKLAALEQDGDDNIDVRIEYETCKTIMSGLVNGAVPPVPSSACADSTGTAESCVPDAPRTVIIEGRNPAVMAAYCRTLGKTEVLSLYLSCSPRVQARRFVGREIDRALSFAIDALLPPPPAHSSAVKPHGAHGLSAHGHSAAATHGHRAATGPCAPGHSVHTTPRTHSHPAGAPGHLAHAAATEAGVESGGEYASIEEVAAALESLAAQQSPAVEAALAAARAKNASAAHSSNSNSSSASASVSKDGEWSCKRIGEVARELAMTQSRDNDDRARFLALYGLPQSLDYRSPALYSCVVDTSHHVPSETLEVIERFLAAQGIGREMLRDGDAGAAARAAEAEAKDKQAQAQVQAQTGATAGASGDKMDAKL